MTLEHRPSRVTARGGRSRRGTASVLVIAAGLLTGCDDSTSVSGAIPNGEDYAPRVTQVCGESLPKVDCACFWKQGKAAFTAGNLESLLQALAEREKWGGQITRVRMEKVAGPEAARTINRALFDCTSP